MRKLERSLSLFNVVAISIGAMLGGEIFVLPAVAAQMTGPSLWLAYLIAAFLVLPAALSKSELATAMPDSGGSYLYIERAMGPLAGTIAGLGLWLSLLLKSTFALAILGSYLALLVAVPLAPVAMALLVLVIGLNVVGVRKVGTVQMVVVAVTVAALGALVVGGGRFLPDRPDAAGPWLADGLGGLAAATGLVFISYAGVTKIAAIAEEVEDEARNIPRGIIISLLAMGLLYTGVALVLARAFSPRELVGDATPIASLAALVAGDPGKTIIAVTAVLALLGMTNTGLLAASRFPFAMARDRLFPELFQHVSRRFVTPVAAIVLTGVAMAVMLLTLDVIRIAKLASAFMIASFCAANVAVVILRESGAQWYRPAFSSPLYPYLQVFGFVTGMLILLSMGLAPLVGLAVTTAAGAALYLVYGRTRVKRLGVLRQMIKRHDLLDTARVRTKTGSYTGLPGIRTVVALFGKEPSAEALVHLGMTLAPDRCLEVLYLEEVPEQTVLGAMMEEPDDRLESLERRVLSLAEEREVATRFDVVLTRDIRETLYDYAARIESRWVVMAWRDRTMRGLIVRNPMEWLMTHMPCNLALFKDAGIRTYRKVMAVAAPGPHDALVVRTADNLARLFRAEITFVRCLPSTASEQDIEATRLYHEQLSRLCQTPTHSEIVQGDDEVDAMVKATARHDLVILGAPPEGPIKSMFFPTREERITEHAHCAVLRLRAPRAEAHESVVNAPDSEVRASARGAQSIAPALTHVGLDVADKQALFMQLGESFASLVPGVDAETIERELWERERLQNTSVGHGVAIPHATVPQAPRTQLCVVTLAKPIDYDGDNPEKIDVVLCLVGPSSDRETHLRLLSHLARLVIEGDLLGDLRPARVPAEVVEALRLAGARLEARSAQRIA